MELIVGPQGQGKLEYLLSRGGILPAQVADGATCPLDAPPPGTAALNHLHLWVRRALQDGKDPAALFARWEAEIPTLAVLCDEVGSGLVPMDAFERQWREEVGRLCCRIAARARRVERVFCGLPTLLKGEWT